MDSGGSEMRKFIFFSIGLGAAVCMVTFFSQDEASSRRRKIVRPPKLRASVIFPKAEDSTLLSVSFSHASHSRVGYKKCDTCHNDEVFSEKQELNSNKITMDAINEGKFCGHCHNGKTKTEDGERTIFGPKEGRIPQCVLCHNVKMRKPPITTAK
jgi:c(7)-type cytochrome triheme protein